MSTATFGSRNGMGKRYTDETVWLARSVYKPGVFGYRQIAQLTGIPKGTIRQWVTGVTRDRAAA